MNMRFETQRHHADPWTVASAGTNAQTEFIHKTYQHVALALLAFVGLEALLLHTPGVEKLVSLMVGGRFSWLVVLGLYMAVSTVADRWASSAVNVGKQYLGLALYVGAVSVVWLPLLYIASYHAGADVIPKAAMVTGIVFGGLTAMVLISKKDFSFLGGILRVMGFGALALIVVSVFFPFTLGTVFAGFLAVFAAGSIVYNTSNLVHRYRPGQHVAAALSLFASIALLFYYILTLFLGSRD